MTQADLAREVPVAKTSVNRWVNDRPALQGSTAARVRRIFAERGVAVDLAPGYRVFLASPMAALDADGYERARSDTERVHAVLDRIASPVYWAAGGIGSAEAFEAPDLATARNLNALRECEAFVFLQTAEVRRPSSSHVELGMAIALHKPVTVFAPSKESLPYMLRDFEAIAARDGGRFRFCPAGDALRLLEIHGGELLGIGAAVAA